MAQSETHAHTRARWPRSPRWHWRTAHVYRRTHWLSQSMNSLGSIRISSSAPQISGVIFEAARPAEELAQIETRASAPDFWSNQADAQKVLQRRRRVEEEVQLISSLK